LYAVFGVFGFGGVTAFVFIEEVMLFSPLICTTFEKLAQNAGTFETIAISQYHSGDIDAPPRILSRFSNPIEKGNSNLDHSLLFSHWHRDNSRLIFPPLCTSTKFLTDF